MEEKILLEINKLIKIGISDIDLLALVTDSSYEVVFYGIYNKEKLQSNEICEKEIIEYNVMDAFYKKIAMIIRESYLYNSSKMNIVRYTNNGDINISYDDKNSRVYKIKKEWKMSI